ncbi:hypothetical protein [Methylobacterium fujisawaense]
MNATASDVETMRRFNRLYVGRLDADEIAAFDNLCSRCLMQRSYERLGGLMGLAQARITSAGHAAIDAASTTPVTAAAE